MKEKLKIVDYGFTTDDRSTVRVYTADGGIIDAKRCPTGDQQWFRTSTQAADRLMLRYQVDHVDIATHEDYVRGLLSLFHRR